MCCTRFLFYWGIKKWIFLLEGHKVNIIPPAGQTNPFFDPPVEKKSCATWEKHLFSLVAQHTIFLPRGGNKMHFTTR